MTVSTLGARHRAARRASTPLTELASTASAQIGVVGRRSAVVAASSGLVVSMVGGAPAAADTGDVLASGVDTAALTAAAHAVLATAPVVTSPVEAAFTTDVTAVAAVKPAPVVVKRATSVSRSAARTTTAAAVANNPAPASVAGNAVLEIAARYVGVPYVFGGSSPDGFDCSGFLSYVYAQLGISLPRSSSAYPSIGTRVSAQDAQPGDVIWSPGHVAIYAGGGMQIDSPRPGKTVQFRGIWQSNPVFIRVS